MPHINLFNECNDSLSGVKTLRLCAKKSSGEALSFPLDVVFKESSTETLLLENNPSDNVITINDVDYDYRVVKPNYADFNQDILETRQGLVYRKDLTFTFPKIDLITNNQIRNFLFGQGEQFAISNIVAFITDMNDMDWIVGWDYGLVLDEFNLQTDTRGGENIYVFRYFSESYQPALKYEEIT